MEAPGNDPGTYCIIIIIASLITKNHWETQEKPIFRFAIFQ
jgi:hypothetical protein